MKKAISIILLTAILVLSLAGCGISDSKKLVGKWTGEKNAMGITVSDEIVFNEGGSGTVSVGGIGVGIAMNYTVDEKNDKLTVTTDTPILQKTFEYTYSFEKNTLTLTDSDNNSSVYTKAQ